jgi:outer membrane protein assembly factor BamB
MTGELLWEQQYGDAMDIPSSAAAAYGNIYVAFNVLDSYNGTWQVMMTCLDEATGAMVWSWTTSTTYGGYPWMAPLVAAGTVYWTDYNGGHVYANDAVTGDILWTYEIPNDGWVDGGPTYWGGMIFIEDDVGQVTALDALTGNLIWMTSSYDDYFSSAVAVDNGVVYALGSSSILHALDAFTGETLWQTDDIGGWSPYQSPIVANGMAYFGVNLYSSNSTVRFIAVDTATGDTIWSTMLYDTNLDESFAYNNGSLFVACNDGVLYVIDASNGDVLQALDVNSGVWLASVALGDGVVVVSSGNGTIAAFAFAGVGEPRDVVITPDTGAVEVTGSMAFHAAAIDVLGHQLEGYSINWSSANGLGTIVPTDEFGEDIVFVAGPIAGTETLYANVGIYAAAATVNILAGDTYTVVVQPADCYLVAGDTQQFTAIALDRWGNEISGATFSWDASPSIGIVDGTGLLTAGTAVATGAVSATFAGVTGTAEVEVGPGPLVSLAANPNSVTDIVDSTTIIVATAYDQFGNEIPGLTFVWATDIGSVTTASQASAVFNAGTVVGYGNITLSCGAVSVYVPVQVLPGAPYQVIVQPVDCQVVATDTQQFTAIAYDIWGNEVPGTNFVWDASPSIGMINGAGLLTAGTATATGVVSAAFAGVTGFAEVEVVPGPLVSIAASPNSVTDVVDSSTIVLATGYDQFGNEISGLAFVWSTDIGSIAAGPQASTLFSAGTVAGYGNITLSCGTLSIYVQVHVLPGALYQIILTPTDIELIPDQTQAFSAVPVDIYGNVISGLTLTWSASSSIGTITQGGVLTAGTTVATGTVNVGSGMIAAEASVEVVPGALDSIVVAPAFLTITVGSTTSLTATGYDQYGNALTGLTFVWSADSGTVTALGDRSIAQYGAPTVAGSATVTVSVGMVSTQVPATIIPGPLAHLSVSPTSESISAGGTQTFTATGTDVFGNVLSGLTLAWSASSALGTISQAGVLTAATTVATGTVTVTSGSFTATADVEVVPDALASIVLSPSPLATVAGHTEAIAAVGLDQYGNEIAGLTFTWSATAGTVSPIDVIRSMVTYAVPTSAGFENVTATVGAVSGTVQVTIAPGQLMTIVVTPISTNVTAGSGTSFSAQPLDMYGNPIPGTTITWTTTGGTITPAGVLSAPTAVGSIVVTATSGSVHGRASVGVIPGALDSIMVSPTTLDLKTGDGASIVVKAYDQYGNELDGLTMTWSTTIGTIDASEDGYEAAFGAGEQTGKGTITVICGDESASVTVDIGSASIPLGRQLAQPMSLLFIAIAVILGLLLLMMYLKGRKAGGGETEQESGPQENTGA